MQHGFQKKKGTTSGLLLELQAEISSSLDKGLKFAPYSTDMSAAFELLQPNLFHQLDLPDCIMNPIMDFLSQRTMMVEYDGHTSSIHHVSVGCVQGSVLCPKLFSIYCKDLGTSLPSGTHIVSYAVYSYVTISSPDVTTLKTKLQDSITTHKAFMESVGMVINKQKTDLASFLKKDATRIELDNGISYCNSLKALGITFSHNFNWENHFFCS